MTIVNLNKVTLAFNGANKRALTNINYQIKKGDFVILLGSNGSGKSSLLKLLYRHYQPNDGEIKFLGKAIKHFSANDLNAAVSILTQNCDQAFFSSLTLYENYLLAKASKHFLLTSHHKERAALKKLLHDYNPNLLDKLDCTIDQFSGGERQALALAFCMLQTPSLLLLDEHTSALDPNTSQQIMSLTQKMVSQHHITCVLTTHDLDIALTYGNRILILREGEVYKTIDDADKQNLDKDTLIRMYR